ncbi:hypothetical protein LT493_12365 [Streptomyces tricolor]|nr:hypothetical protein [Streptomyces tricolor]
MFTILSNTCKLGADTGLVRFVSATSPWAAAGRWALYCARPSYPRPWPGCGGRPAAAAVPRGGHHAPCRTCRRPTPSPSSGSSGLFLPVATVGLVLLGATQGHGTVLPFVGVEQMGKPVLRVAVAVPVACFAPGLLALAAAWLLPALAGTVVAWIRPCAAAAPPAAPRVRPRAEPFPARLLELRGTPRDLVRVRLQRGLDRRRPVVRAGHRRRGGASTPPSAASSPRAPCRNWPSGSPWHPRSAGCSPSTRSPRRASCTASRPAGSCSSPGRCSSSSPASRGPSCRSSARSSSGRARPGRAGAGAATVNVAVGNAQTVP